jgi:hypothetical protein
MSFSRSIVPSIGIATALMSSDCTTDSPYFGKTTPPSEQRLVYANGDEPESFDPAKYAGGTEMRIINALFDGLTKFHPTTLEPMAALATHYETNADQSQFTFYLRGHPNPRGIRLPNTDTLSREFEVGRIKEDFARGRSAPLDRIPARWSDGTVITAHDFVYSWRRVVDPQPLLTTLTSFTTSRTQKRSTRPNASRRIWECVRSTTSLSRWTSVRQRPSSYKFSHNASSFLYRATPWKLPRRRDASHLGPNPVTS